MFSARARGRFLAPGRPAGRDWDGAKPRLQATLPTKMAEIARARVPGAVDGSLDRSSGVLRTGHGHESSVYHPSLMPGWSSSHSNWDAVRASKKALQASLIQCKLAAAVH